MDFASPRLVHVSVRARGGPLVHGSRTGFRPHPICLRGMPLSVGPALAPCPESPVCGTSFLLLFSFCLRGGPLFGLQLFGLKLVFFATVCLFHWHSIRISVCVRGGPLSVGPAPAYVYAFSRWHSPCLHVFEFSTAISSFLVSSAA